jgi:hypothetical protein
LQTIPKTRIRPYLARLIKSLKGLQGPTVEFIGEGERILSIPDGLSKGMEHYFEFAYGVSVTKYYEEHVQEDNLEIVNDIEESDEFIIGNAGESP